MSAFQVSTTDNSKAFLAALPNAIRAGLGEIGAGAEAYAKGNVPVDTGALKASIGSVVNGSDLILGAGTDYAIYVELGTQHQKAQPYLRPAMENHADEYKQHMENALKNG